jgi:hypothetical protein
MKAFVASFQVLRFLINCVLFLVMLFLGIMFYAGDLLSAACRYFITQIDKYAANNLDDNRE